MAVWTKKKRTITMNWYLKRRGEEAIELYSLWKKNEPYCSAREQQYQTNNVLLLECWIYNDKLLMWIYSFTWWEKRRVRIVLCWGFELVGWWHFFKRTNSIGSNTFHNVTLVKRWEGENTIHNPFPVRTGFFSFFFLISPSVFFPRMQLCLLFRPEKGKIKKLGFSYNFIIK